MQVQQNPRVDLQVQPVFCEWDAFVDVQERLLADTLIDNVLFDATASRTHEATTSSIFFLTSLPREISIQTIPSLA